MSATGLDVFDKTLQTTHVWLNEITDVIGPDKQVAWHVLGAVLRTLRDRVPLQVAVHLGAELPLFVRGLYYDQWHAPGRMDEKPGSLEEFLAPIGPSMNGIVRPILVARGEVVGVWTHSLAVGRHTDAPLPELFAPGVATDAEVGAALDRYRAFITG